MAVTTPPDELTDATAGTLLAHVPLPVVEVKVAVSPTHKCATPVTDVAGFTVMGFQTVQPATVYEMLSGPAVMPVTIPEEDPTMAMDDSEPHTPEAEGSVNISVPPAHTFEPPNMGDGDGPTVTNLVTVQPIPMV